MAATQARLEAVLAAASDLLAARLDEAVTVEQWLAIAGAVSSCGGVTTACLLLGRDLDRVAAHPLLPWDEAVDGPLPRIE